MSADPLTLLLGPLVEAGAGPLLAAVYLAAVALLLLMLLVLLVGC